MPKQIVYVAIFSSGRIETVVRQQHDLLRPAPPWIMLYDADRVISVSDRGEVRLVKCREEAPSKDPLLRALKHHNPYTEDDRKMSPAEVWADGYAAGLEDGK